MPIRINLLEEEQKAKLAKKRDPVMLAIRLSVLGILALVAFSVILYARQRALNERLLALKSEWGRREPKYQKAESDINTLTHFVAKTGLIRSQVDNRFLWAPQLELYKDVVPYAVQITRFVGHRELSTPPQAGANPAPSTQVETIKVTLEGITEGARPELVVNDFLGRLKSDQKLADYAAEIQLISLTKGVSTPGRDEKEPGSDIGGARFVIEIQYKHRPAKHA